MIERGIWRRRLVNILQNNDGLVSGVSCPIFPTQNYQFSEYLILIIYTGRMISNTLGEVRARAELDDTGPDFKEQVNILQKQGTMYVCMYVLTSFGTDGIIIMIPSLYILNIDTKMTESKKRKRDDIMQLEKRLDSTRRRVSQVENR